MKTNSKLFECISANVYINCLNVIKTVYNYNLLNVMQFKCIYAQLQRLAYSEINAICLNWVHDVNVYGKLKL